MGMQHPARPTGQPGRGRRLAIASAVALVVAVAVSIPAARAIQRARHPSDPLQRLSIAGAGRVPRTAAQRLQDCRRYAATHTFLEAEHAVVDPDGSITISGHLGAQVCGGVHPASSTWHPGVATFTVMPSAAVQRLRNSGHGPVDVPINAASLPTYLTGDTNGRFFVYTGPSTAIVSMTELYYP